MTQTLVPPVFLCCDVSVLIWRHPVYPNPSLYCCISAPHAAASHLELLETYYSYIQKKKEEKKPQKKQTIRLILCWCTKSFPSLVSCHPHETSFSSFLITLTPFPHVSPIINPPLRPAPAVSLSLDIPVSFLCLTLLCIFSSRI